MDGFILELCFKLRCVEMLFFANVVALTSCEILVSILAVRDSKSHDLGMFLSENRWL